MTQLRHETETRLLSLGRGPIPGGKALLDGFDCPAILLSPDYRILACNRAYEMHYGRSVNAGRDRCYAVSHGYDTPCDENGESCPLRAATASGHPERVFHIHHHPDGPEHVDVELRPLHDDDGHIVAFVELIRPVVEASARADGTFVGRSRAFQTMLGLLARAAPTEAPVLLLGESGAGKELAARAVHDRSGRRGGPFVPVECSGLSEPLFESELFGHVKGAFTGAVSRKEGLVEAATGGTLFLDEIGDIPRALQVKLLRLLESSTYRRVGDTEPRRADFRLVCATHRSLDAMVSDGHFRKDLYYRINTFPIHVPSLRERREDIPLLARAMLEDTGKHLSAEAERRLMTHSFPGNVRELRNVLERAVILTDGAEITSAALPDDVRGREPLRPSAPPPARWPWGDEVLPLDEVVDRYLRWAESAHQGERRELASRLGVSERTLYRRLKAARDRHGADERPPGEGG